MSERARRDAAGHGRRIAWATAFLLLGASLPRRATAQVIAPREYAIDASQTLVLSHSRALGMGGAYATLGATNPASYGARGMYHRRPAQFGMPFGFLLPGAFAADDFFNNGQGGGLGGSINAARFFDLGLGFLVKDGGFGVKGQLLSFDVASRDGALGASPPVEVQLQTVQAGGGYALYGGALVFGVGLRYVALTVQDAEDDIDLLELRGVGAELGATLRPHGRRYRVAASLRTAVEASPEDGTGTGNVGGFAIPSRVSLPWEGRIGAAYQFGPRPLNRRYDPPKRVGERIEARMRAEPPPGISTEGELEDAIDGATDDEERYIHQVRFDRYDALPRRYVLLAADLAFVGAVDDAVGIDAFLDRQARPRGQRTTIALHVGMEGEPWENRLKLRAGLYTEPARNAAASTRVHGTGGFDLRLFRWALLGPTRPFDFRASFTFDAASSYLDLGVGFGLWR